MFTLSFAIGIPFQLCGLPVISNQIYVIYIIYFISSTTAFTDPVVLKSLVHGFLGLSSPKYKALNYLPGNPRPLYFTVFHIVGLSTCYISYKYYIFPL